MAANPLGAHQVGRGFADCATAHVVAIFAGVPRESVSRHAWELAEAVGLAERHVSRQLRLAYLAPEVLKRLTCGREASAVSLYDLCFLAGAPWGEQMGRAVE